MRLITTFALSSVYGQLRGQDVSQPFDPLRFIENVKGSSKANYGSKRPMKSDLKTVLEMAPRAQQFADVTGDAGQTDFSGNTMSNIGSLTPYPMVYGDDSTEFGCGVVADSRSRKRRAPQAKDARMFNGAYPSDMSDHPWFVYVLVASAGDWHHCGGVVISKEWILTTASCLDSANVDIEFIKVVVGERLNIVRNFDSAVTSDDWSGINENTVERWIVHHQYGSLIANSDIALLQLASDSLLNVADSSSHQYPACLPKSTTCLNADDGITLDVGGWGQHHDTNNQLQKRFLQGQVPLRKAGDCDWWMSNFHALSPYNHHAQCVKTAQKAVITPQNRKNQL